MKEVEATIVEILEGAQKTNSSYGNWSVVCIVAFPWTTTQHTFFFWRKKDAKKIKKGEKVKVSCGTTSF